MTKCTCNVAASLIVRDHGSGRELVVNLDSDTASALIDALREFLDSRRQAEVVQHLIALEDAYHKRELERSAQSHRQWQELRSRRGLFGW